jgi:hypothetical protein
MFSLLLIVGVVASLLTVLIGRGAIPAHRLNAGLLNAFAWRYDRIEDTKNESCNVAGHPDMNRTVMVGKPYVKNFCTVGERFDVPSSPPFCANQILSVSCASSISRYKRPNSTRM